jgi:hypothetical protein
VGGRPVKIFVKPGAVITRPATGSTRTVVNVDGHMVVWRDEFGEGTCSVIALRNWTRKHTSSEQRRRRREKEQRC